MRNYCIKCGAKLAQGAVFCISCGAYVTQTKAAEGNPPAGGRPKRRLKPVIAVCAVAASLIAVAALVLITALSGGGSAGLDCYPVLFSREEGEKTVNYIKYDFDAKEEYPIFEGYTIESYTVAEDSKDVVVCLLADKDLYYYYGVIRLNGRRKGVETRLVNYEGWTFEWDGYGVDYIQVAADGSRFLFLGNGTQDLSRVDIESLFSNEASSPYNAEGIYFSSYDDPIFVSDKNCSCVTACSIEDYSTHGSGNSNKELVYITDTVKIPLKVYCTYLTPLKVSENNVWYVCFDDETEIVELCRWNVSEGRVETETRSSYSADETYILKEIYRVVYAEKLDALGITYDDIFNGSLDYLGSLCEVSLVTDELITVGYDGSRKELRTVKNGVLEKFEPIGFEFYYDWEVVGASGRYIFVRDTDNDDYYVFNSETLTGESFEGSFINMRIRNDNIYFIIRKF